MSLCKWRSLRENGIRAGDAKILLLLLLVVVVVVLLFSLTVFPGLEHVTGGLRGWRVARVGPAIGYRQGPRGPPGLPGTRAGGAAHGQEGPRG